MQNDSSSQLSDSSDGISYSRDSQRKIKKKVRKPKSPQPNVLNRSSSLSNIESLQSSRTKARPANQGSQVTQQTNSTLQQPNASRVSQPQPTVDNSNSKNKAKTDMQGSKLNQNYKNPLNLQQSRTSTANQLASSTLERSDIGEPSGGGQVSVSQVNGRIYKKLHYVDMPNRFGVASLVDKHEQLRGQRTKREKLEKFKPHTGQNDILTKIMYSIEQEEKLQKQLKNRIVTLSSIDREVELFDKEQELKKQLAKIKRETLNLNIKYKQTDYKSNRIVQEQLTTGKLVEKLRSDIRATNKAFLSKREKINELNKQLETIQQRVDKFQSLVPLLHDRLETGAINQDFDSLIEFFKKVVSQDLNSKNQQSSINNQYKAQQDEIEKLIQTNEYVQKVLENQREVNKEEEKKLKKQIDEMRRKKHEMVEEYELLYEKYQQIISDE